MIPPRLFRLQVPDPQRTATGMSTLVLAASLLGGDPEGRARFTGAVRPPRNPKASHRRDR